MNANHKTNHKKGAIGFAPAALMLACLTVIPTNSVATEEIPPGFHRMPNGDIMANNPSKAVAPEGYRLSEDGVLRKIEEGSAAGDLLDALSNEINSESTGSDSLGSGAIGGEAVAGSMEAAQAQKTGSAATVDDFGAIPPGYHTMAGGVLMANDPSRAVAPEGYHLMPDGTLMRHGARIDHSRHSHKGGGMLMAEYKYERMYMDGLLDTTDSVSSKVVVNGTSYNYNMAPTDMTMDMHMVMLMYHTRNYMIMGMGHYMSNNMGMVSNDGTESTMSNAGLADTVITVEAPVKGVDLKLGISLPTGSIDERGMMQHTATSASVTKYPYGMQLGSGTYDFIMGAGYQTRLGGVQLGANFEYTARTGTNDNNYTLGDKYTTGAWARFTLNRTMRADLDLKFRETGRISGADPELNTTMSPTADFQNYGGQRLDMGLGLKYENAGMSSIAAEFTMPLYQNLFGPQMETSWIMGLKGGFMF